MQGVGNSIKIVFFCLYCKAAPFKIPSRGVILHLTPLPLFITSHFSSLCEEGKVRKLKERLDCVCVCNKENVTIQRGGLTREKRMTANTDIDTESVQPVRKAALHFLSLTHTADLVHTHMYYNKCERVYLHPLKNEKKLQVVARVLLINQISFICRVWVS